MKKDSVVFYYEWLPLVASLANASKLRFYEIITNPDLRDTIIDDDPHLKGVVDFVKIKIAQNEVKYQETIEKRRLAGSNGGKQKLANASKSKQKLANVADNVNENVNVNVKESNIDTLPDWIPKDLWADFLAMRKSLGKPATKRAKVLILKKLENWQLEGQDVTKIIEQSILKSWQDVFPLKEQYGTIRQGNQQGFAGSKNQQRQSASEDKYAILERAWAKAGGVNLGNAPS